MATLKKYDLNGKEVGLTQIDDAKLEVSAHSQSIKDYIIAIRNNARQWSANTKRRADSHHTGKKPHPQKGQGRSRQGDLAAPHYKGGAVVFGPQPKDIHTRINRKERRAAIQFLLAEKIKGNKVHVLQNEEMDAPKTKTVAQFLDQMTMKTRRVLVLGNSTKSMNFGKSLRNIPKKEFMPFSQVNGYEIVRCQEIIVLDSAVEQLMTMFG